MNLDDKRPDPDLLLESLASDRAAPRKRGRLKIYLGMAAGVGKTYAMLSDARLDRERGRDIVVGYVESHGRPDTDALLSGFEVVPVIQINHQGVTIREFDIDALLRRRPAIALVDELPHTNAVECRHPKRYLDIEELLDAGIDVRTTVNVQHIESLNDFVEKVTGVPVRETVPDRIFLNADEVEVVDIPPDELIERIREGRIYSRDKIESALRNFFSSTNLGVLRELTLRHAADRISESVVTSGRWSSRERVLVCIAPDAYSAATVREARRIASAMNGALFALSVETAAYAERPERSASSEVISLAERLGATVIVRSSSDVVSEVLRIAKEQRITQIIIGRPPRRNLLNFYRQTFLDRLMRSGHGLSIHVVDTGRPGRPRTGALLRILRIRGGRLSDLARPTIVTIICSILSWPISYYLDPLNILMIYLVGVVWAATRYSKIEAILTSILGVLFFDFLFIPPYFTFAVSDIQYVITFLVMLFVGLIISRLVADLHIFNRAIEERERRTSSLYELVNRLSQVDQQHGVTAVAQEQIQSAFQLQSLLFFSDKGELVFGEERTLLSDKEIGIASWTLRNNQLSGAGTDTLPTSEWLFIPMSTAGDPPGVLAVRPGKRELDRNQISALRSFALNLGLTIQRLKSEEESNQNLLRAEQEEIRSVFLSAVSHDLRTPLTSIEGAATAILTRVDAERETISELAQSVVDESQRLGSIIRNILDVTRFGRGEIQPNFDWYSLEEILGSALRVVEPHISRRSILVSISSELPMVWVDGILMEQLFINLFENFKAYTEDGSRLEITACSRLSTVEISLEDNGPGISSVELQDVVDLHDFSALTSGNASGMSRPGLGLRICSAIARAHSGEFRMESATSGRGARFRVVLPLRSLPSSPGDDDV